MANPTKHIVQFGKVKANFAISLLKIGSGFQWYFRMLIDGIPMTNVSDYFKIDKQIVLVYLSG